MGRRGPKPEPAAVKIAKGNSGRRPIGADPVVPDDRDADTSKVGPKGIAPPRWLKGEGLKVWKRLEPRLTAMKLLTQIDAEAFGRYCRNFARWLKMQQTLDDEGETYESESAHGKLKRAHPAFLIADRLERQLASAEANFGLNPAERQRLFAARAVGQIGDLFGGSGVPEKKPAAAPVKSEPPRSPSAVGFLQ